MTISAKSALVLLRFASVLPLLPAAVAAADPVTPPAVVFPAEKEAETYAYCMKLAKADAAAALRLATEWRQRGGAHPADHCGAVALVELGKYREGAAKLETLAQAMVDAPASLRADVLDQAGQAWLLAGEPERAYAAAGEAVQMAPKDLELRIDRAEAAAAAGHYDAAVADLDIVLAADPNRAEALAYRASAYRALDRLDPALADIDRALALKPDWAPALLERGDIRRLLGDADGARRDWQRVGEVAAGTQADMAARANLENLAAAKAKPPAPAAAGGRK
jgi:tetratricopeptide (TPR) repeat protein